MMVWLWILIGLNISELKGYSHGNFPQACDSMLPVHDHPGGVFPPQSSEPPFEVIYERGRIEDPITVILKGKDSRRFRGFMLEARNRNLGGDGPPVGKFITLDSQMTRLLKCNNLPDSAVSQRLLGYKSEFRVNWTVQGEDLDIIFRATFLQEYELFWERVTAILFRPTSTSVPSTTEPTTAATTTESTKPTTITESTEPTTESAKPTTTTESTEPTTESTKPTTITEFTEPTTESTEPTTESTKPTTTTESTEPTTESTEPTTITESTEPTTESTEPTTESTEPTTTTESATEYTTSNNTTSPSNKSRYSKVNLT
ncbi:ferric-chelate reductase 1 [Austrofundulus limnaeus]|uniref:Ferric-chelate reductase 1 n=1 Tax=Austrofundulus limnaeus TaxID=52670 RepID=A0A2I4ART5_AUSLI|nr:PREDICTED: ferric-chelate reductase 1-like [Austrofundulus limnaeus]